MDKQENNLNLNILEDENELINAINELKIEIKKMKLNILKKEMLLEELTKQVQEFKS